MAEASSSGSSSEPQSPGASRPGPPGKGASGGSDEGSGSYKIPVIAGGVVAAVAAAVILPFWLAPGPDYSAVGDCAEVFDEPFTSGLGFDELRMREVEPDPEPLAAPVPEGSAVRECADTGAGRLSVRFAVLESDEPSAAEASDLVAELRTSQSDRKAAAAGLPFATVETTDLDAGDEGFVALYAPPEDMEPAYDKWTPAGGQSHATAAFSTRNLLVQLTVYGGDRNIRESPMHHADSVAEDLAVRLEEVGEFEDL